MLSLLGGVFRLSGRSSKGETEKQKEAELGRPSGEPLTSNGQA